MSFIFWKFHDFRQRGPPFLLASLRSQRFLRLLIQFPPLFMVLISGCCWIIWIWMSFWDSGCTLYDMQELQQSHEYSSTYHQSQASNHGGWFVSIGCKELSDKITIAPTKQNKTKKRWPIQLWIHSITKLLNTIFIITIHCELIQLIC